ncbi:hypothetical protein [Hymenobacter arizonensis]|uniref:YD repeat-containing protein n=1 Tax=Hymenobacter arizonensis TaxID=1227077 RepID=A0A1I5XCS5_HYMAR|nr:hypothetical protein [Hymenobacter arizonensis]SFQ29782.1 hypothetical protein SAMN04515668_1772 [Hymenobacter arizonensis]
MKLSPLSTSLLWTLALGVSSGAQAQSPATAGPRATSTIATTDYAQVAAGQAARYTAAYDSLMRLVTNIHTRSEARMGYFKATHSTFGGLRRKTQTYTGHNGPQVKMYKEKRLFGTTLQKVRYYDERGRKVLTERYVDKQLTSLKLSEYTDPLNTPAAKWVFAKGDYLQYASLPLFGRRQYTYYTKSRPATE